MPELVAVPNPPTSPFDGIRVWMGTDEWWYARDLMSLLGYESWRRFEDAIERAKVACANTGGDVANNFADAVKKSTGRGRPAKDYRLTRYACYLVALNGDPTKPEIAAAQQYFVVQTRKAEVAKLVPAMSELDVLRSVVDNLIAVRDEASQAKQIALDAAEDTRVVSARLDAIEGRHDWFAALGWAKAYGWAQTDSKTLARLGTIAGTIGRQQGLEVTKTQHGLYGTVNMWPKYVWDEAAARFQGA